MPDALPPAIATKLAAAAQRLAAGDHREAEALCREALAAQPSVPEAHYMLGVIAAGEDRHDRALAAFDHALDARANFAEALGQKARSLVALGRSSEAMHALEAAARLAPRDAYTLDTLGNVLTRSGLHERAVEFYRKAAGANPWPGYRYNLAAALQFVGRLDEAREAYRVCLKADPMHAMAWSGLIQITSQTAEANDIAGLERAFAAHQRHPEALHALGHALAKAMEDLGRPGDAMTWLARAKSPMRSRAPSSTEEDRLFASVERSILPTAAGGQAGAGPIFIVGMPRTGTTLVERILSSHSQVVSGGELNDFPQALARVVGLKPKHLIDPDVIDAAANVDAAAVGEAYLASVKAAQGLEGRFTDKLPPNIFLAPHVLRALSQARVICLRRHPADAVLGVYRQAFAFNSHAFDYAFDLEATARHYVRFDRLVRRYGELLPSDRFMQVSYEAVVADLETEVRRLLEFCGLGFEPSCLAFHENKAPVATASAAQVRLPLYATSVDRWKRYRPGLDPALAILAEAGCLASKD